MWDWISRGWRLHGGQPLDLSGRAGVLQASCRRNLVESSIRTVDMISSSRYPTVKHLVFPLGVSVLLTILVVEGNARWFQNRFLPQWCC